MWGPDNDISFSKDVEPNGKDIHKTLSRTYKEVERLMHDVRNSSNGSVSKYNYYGKKYRFQQITSPREIPHNLNPNTKLQSPDGKQQKASNNTRPQRLQSIEHTRTQHHSISTSIPLKYEIVFQKEASKNIVPTGSEPKQYYLNKKILNLQKQVADLRAQNQKLRRSSLSSLIGEPAKRNQKQKKIKFAEKFIKDLQ